MRREASGFSRIVVVVVIAAIYVLRIDHAAGLIVDDAWYVLLAKALASGQGFRLISSAATPILPTVPPGFPAMLAPVFWIKSAFPDNLILLKLVSIVAMGIAAVATYRDYVRNRDVDASIALWLTAIVALTPALVFLATSTVMSECVFLCVQMLALVAIERASRDDRDRAGLIAIAALLAAVTYLVRITGLALIAAAIVYFISRGQRRRALIFAAVVALSAGPWELYARTHQPTADERAAHGGTIAYPYLQLVATDRPGDPRPMPLSNRLRRAVSNVAGVATRDVGGALMPVLYRGGSESGEETVSIGPPDRASMGSATGTMIVSLVLTMIIMAGIARSRAWLSLPVLLMVATIVMISSVAALTFRYVLPLTPFLVLFLWRGIGYPAASRVAVATLLALHLVDHGAYLLARTQGTADWLGDAQEVDQVLDWLSSRPDGNVASSNPPLVYLRTGRKGIYLINPDANRDRWLSWNVRFLAALRPMAQPGSGADFQTSRRGLWVVEMNEPR